MPNDPAIFSNDFSFSITGDAAILLFKFTDPKVSQSEPPEAHQVAKIAISFDGLRKIHSLLGLMLKKLDEGQQPPKRF